MPYFLTTLIILYFHIETCPQISRDSIVVSTLRCGRKNPGSNPGHGMGITFYFLSCKMWNPCKKKSTSPGFEPGIFWSVVRRVIRCAMRPLGYMHNCYHKNICSLTKYFKFNGGKKSLEPDLNQWPMDLYWINYSPPLYQLSYRGNLCEICHLLNICCEYIETLIGRN